MFLYLLQLLDIIKKILESRDNSFQGVVSYTQGIIYKFRAPRNQEIGFPFVSVMWYFYDGNVCY